MRRGLGVGARGRGSQHPLIDTVIINQQKRSGIRAGEQQLAATADRESGEGRVVGTRNVDACAGSRGGNARQHDRAITIDVESGQPRARPAAQLVKQDEVLDAGSHGGYST